MRAFTDSHNSLKSPESTQNIMTESWLVNKSPENITIIWKWLKRKNDKYKYRSLHSTHVLNINGMQSDQTGQIQKILRMESKDFPCSLKRNLLCPAGGFLYLPAMGGDQEKITIGKKKSGYKLLFKTLQFNVLTQRYKAIFIL